MQSLFVCIRGKSPTRLPAGPWVDAVSFAVPVALADVNEVEGQCEDEDEREVVAEAVHDAGDTLALIVDEGDGSEDVADPHGDGDPDALARHAVAANDEVDEEDRHGEIHAPGGISAAHAERIVSRCIRSELQLAHNDDQPTEHECGCHQRIHRFLGECRIVHLAELQEVVEDDHVQQAPDNVDGALREWAWCDERIVELPGKVQGQCPEGHAMGFVQVAAMDDHDIRRTPAQP